jgi:hypothetical protein
MIASARNRRRSPEDPRRATPWWVWLLAAVAAARVFLFAAAFPFFNDTDEQDHFDVVMNCAEGRLPRQLTKFLPRSAAMIARFGSPEFLVNPATLPDGRIPPPMWARPSGKETDTALDRDIAAWQSVINHEASQAPLYYLVAAFWMKAGEALGLRGGSLLYWVRFLNLPLAAALVWLGHRVAVTLLPEQRRVAIGVPLLLAVFPQDTFYGIQSDVLSPLCFGLAFLGLGQLLRSDCRTVLTGVGAGLALAATGLVKATNLPLVVVALAAVLWKVRELARAGALRPAQDALLCFGLCAGLPLALWIGWNVSNTGDLTGTSAKIANLGWTSQPLADCLRHPLFTPRGLGVFWSETMASFWRGEFHWHGERMTRPWADAVYWSTSALLPALAAGRLLRSRDGLGPLQTRMLWLGFAGFLAVLAFLAVASVWFDFGQCVYPSRAHPYFTSGRLLTGALIPFLLLYLYGLDFALARVKADWPWWLAVGGLVAVAVASEIQINAPAFASQYNFFHLPK